MQNNYQWGEFSMYQCKLSIIVASGNITIEAAIKSATLPEDCEITVSSVPELTEKYDKLDGAVIFNGIDAYKQGAGLVGKKTLRVLLITGDNLPLVNEMTDKPDELWTVAENNDNDSLLIYYAEKLIAQMKQSFDYRLQTVCFNTAFDSIPDLVWFKDIKGAHLIVNNGFCEAVAKTKEQIYKQGHYYIWDIPKEEYEQGDYVCLESEEVVINARETCLFDEKVKTKKGMRQFKTFKSPLIDEDGTIFGTCGIANDVTAQHNINSELEVILDSMPFAVIIDDEKENVLAANRLFFKYFPDYREIVGTSLSSWKNSVLRGKLEDGEITLETKQGLINLSCSIKPIYSIFEEMIGQAIILTDVTNERKRFEQTAYNANTDFLTGLSNRMRLFEYFDSIKYTPNIATIMVDLDNFKSVNDTYGHKTGDEALILTADILRKSFPIDFIARLGGDEFIILINGECSVDKLKEQTQELLAALNRSFSERSEFSALGASIGAACGTAYDGNAHNFDELLKMSDKAMSYAKNSGKNKICFFGEE